MKDRDNCLRWLDEVDNMISVFDNAVKNQQPIDPMEARNRFQIIRKKLATVIDRVTAS